MLATANAVSSPHLQLDSHLHQPTTYHSRTYKKRSRKQDSDSLFLWADRKWAGSYECCYMACWLTEGAADSGNGITAGRRKSKWWAHWCNSRQDELSSREKRGVWGEETRDNAKGEESRRERAGGTDKEVGGEIDIFLFFCGGAGGWLRCRRRQGREALVINGQLVKDTGCKKPQN